MKVEFEKRSDRLVAAAMLEKTGSKTNLSFIVLVLGLSLTIISYSKLSQCSSTEQLYCMRHEDRVD